MKVQNINGGLLIEVDQSVYNLETIHKCFYWYGANYDISVTDNGGGSVMIRVLPIDAEYDVRSLVSKIKRDLIDFKLRDIISTETKVVRELIVAKAFAHYEEDSNPDTEIADPVGFDPLA